MADNTLLNLGTGGDTIASDDIAGVKFQRVKIVHGIDGVNNGDVAPTNPMPTRLLDSTGLSIGARGDGSLRTVIDPTTLLFDSFETIDTTNTWTIGGTVPPTGSNGSLLVNPGTAASATSFAKSQPTFVPGSNAFLQFEALIQLESGAVTGNQRFWGLGVYVTPTVAVPIVNGVIFEIDNLTGGLFASVYYNGARNQTLALTRPSDGGVHRYSIYYKASRAYYELDNILVASFAFPNPSVSTLSTVIGSINGGAIVAANPFMGSSVIGVADTGRNATKIADGTYPWRTGKVNVDGTFNVSQVDGQKATYSATVIAHAPSATPQDVFTINGSNTKIVRVNRVSVSASQTTAGQINLVLLKRSTANTLGTSFTPAAVAHDSNSAVATGLVQAYTANPTAGTQVGSMRTRKLFVGTAAGTTDEMIVDFGTRNSQAVVLRGPSQVFAVNLNGVTVTGGNFNITIEWTEE